MTSSESDDCVNRRWLPSKSKAADQRLSPRSVPGPPGCFECLRGLGGPDRFDPFNSTAFSFDERTTELAHYCKLSL